MASVKFFGLGRFKVLDDSGNERQTGRRRIVQLISPLAAGDRWVEPCELLEWMEVRQRRTIHQIVRLAREYLGADELPEDQKRLAHKRIEDHYRLPLRPGDSLDLRRLRSKGEQGLPARVRSDLPTAVRALGEVLAPWGERALRGPPSTGLVDELVTCPLLSQFADARRVWFEARVDLGEQQIDERSVLAGLAKAATGSGYYRQVAALVHRLSPFPDLHGPSELAEVTWLQISDAADSVGDAVGRPTPGAGRWRSPRSPAARDGRPGRVRCGVSRTRWGIRRAWLGCQALVYLAE